MSQCCFNLMHTTVMAHASDSPLTFKESEISMEIEDEGSFSRSNVRNWSTCMCQTYYSHEHTTPRWRTSCLIKIFATCQFLIMQSVKMRRRKRYARNRSSTQGQIFELRPPDPSPLPLLLYAVHNSHELCGKYLFLAVCILIYLNLIIFHARCNANGLACWAQSHWQYIGGQLQHRQLVNGTSQHICDVWSL